MTPEQQKETEDALAAMEYDDYDYLIQLCDSMATAEGIVKMEERMTDVKRRYGSYPQDKWDRNMELKGIFEAKMGKSIYEVCMK